MSDPILLVMVALVGFICGGIMIGMGISRLRKWKLMEKTPTSKVADIQNSLVELDGVIRPITGKDDLPGHGHSMYQLYGQGPGI